MLGHLLLICLVAPGHPAICLRERRPTGGLADFATADRSEVSISHVGDPPRALGGTEHDAG